MTVDKITSPRLTRRAESGTVIIRRVCAGCGCDMPAFGVGVQYRAALNAAGAGKPYQHLLGTWWCAGPERCGV